MIELIQIADDQNTDTRTIRLVAKGEDALIPQFTYPAAESEGREFFLQVATANRNLSRFSPGPFDTIALSQMLALVENTEYAKDAIVANITYYDASVEAVLDEDGKPATPFIRPTTGAINRLATTAQITKYLELPQIQGNQFRIGKLARSGDTEVAINPSERVLNHHILVAGSTGSGKSHLLSNLAHCAAAVGRSIILFDHKPDHQDHHRENPEAEFKQAFSLNGADPNLHPVRYWTLDDSDLNRGAAALGVQAQDLDPEILAGAIFYRPDEGNQAEIFAHIATNYKMLQPENNRPWTIHDLRAYVNDRRTGAKGALESLLYGDGGGTIPPQTLQAIKRKVNLPSRVPSFIDPQPRANVVGSSRPSGTIEDLFSKSGLNVIRVIEGDTRGYAVFLSRILQRSAEIRSVAIQEESDVPDLEIIIDEASDIFTAESRHLRDAATGMLAEQVRKGRSLHIGYVISVQSAGDVPERIRNNLNTTIIGRHHNMSILRKALPTSRPEMLEQADKLIPGEMFVDLFETRSLLLVKMDMSRSLLTVAN